MSASNTDRTKQIEALVARVTLAIDVPMVPNFLRIKANGRDVGMVSIDQLDDDALKDIGKAWTETLLRKAERKRLEKR